MAHDWNLNLSTRWLIQSNCFLCFENDSIIFVYRNIQRPLFVSIWNAINERARCSHGERVRNIPVATSMLHVHFPNIKQRAREEQKRNRNVFQNKHTTRKQEEKNQTKHSSSFYFFGFGLVWFQFSLSFASGYLCIFIHRHSILPSYMHSFLCVNVRPKTACVNIYWNGHTESFEQQNLKGRLILQSMWIATTVNYPQESNRTDGCQWFAYGWKDDRNSVDERFVHVLSSLCWLHTSKITMWTYKANAHSRTVVIVG